MEAPKRTFLESTVYSSEEEEDDLKGLVGQQPAVALVPSHRPTRTTVGRWRASLPPAPTDAAAAAHVASQKPAAGQEEQPQVATPPRAAQASSDEAQRSGMETPPAGPEKGRQNRSLKVRGTTAQAMIRVAQPLKTMQSTLQQRKTLQQARGPEISGDEALHRRLWLAAKEADVGEVEALLLAGASVEWRMSQHSDQALSYKNRQLTSQAIHAAAWYSDKKDEKRGHDAARQVVKLLLESNAAATSLAECVVECKDTRKDTRQLQAIHLAAGAGNVGLLDLLVQNHADPDACASLNGKLHYMPIHDAVWFNRTQSVKFLLERRAKITAKNNEDNTALHLAAKLGYVHLVELLLGIGADAAPSAGALVLRSRPSRSSKGSAKAMGNPSACSKRGVRRHGTSIGLSEEQKEGQKKLILMQNNKGKVALDVAVEAGMFPQRSLYLFTLFLADEQLVEAFVTVANKCPEAASALLRSASTPEDEVEDGKMLGSLDPRYRQSMQAEAAAGEGKLDVALLAKLIRSAPQAGVDVLEALTDTPEVKNQEHHPLPIRARVPLGGDFCPLSCVYEDDVDWSWDPTELKHEGGREWHEKFAPKDPKSGHEVQVRVVKLRGLASPRLFSSLAQLKDPTVFTKIAVHALLKFVWEKMKYAFMLDLLYEALAIFVLSRWIVSPISTVFSDPERYDLASRLGWCLVAGQGTLECVTLTWTGWRHHKELGREATVEWLWRFWHRLLLSVMTISLALASQEDHWPGDSSMISATMGAASFLHWLNVLYELRAFQWTGQRLLPIMKSIAPIGGMVVILIFLLLGFMHAFWALDRAHADEVRSWEIMTFLLAGDNFIVDDLLADMEPLRRSALILLGAVGVFTFMACALNLFIAVLGETYDQEQERMVCTFLKERASVCSFMYLRPEVPNMPRPTGANKTKVLLGFVLALTGLLFAVLWCCQQLKMNSWPGALLLAFGALLLQLYLRGALTQDWGSKYLWFCTSTSGAEEMFSLGHDQDEKLKTQGRVWKLKRYILEQCRAVTTNCKDTMSELRDDIAHLRSDVDALTKRLPGVTAATTIQPHPLSAVGTIDSDLVLRLQSSLAGVAGMQHLLQSSTKSLEDQRAAIQRLEAAQEELSRKLLELAAANSAPRRAAKKGSRSHGTTAFRGSELRSAPDVAGSSMPQTRGGSAPLSAGILRMEEEEDD